MKVIAIDPGPINSAYVIWDGKKVLYKKITTNEDFLDSIYDDSEYYNSINVVIEQIASFGMAVGESIFETVYFSGRFAEAFYNATDSVYRIKRHEVKMHLCRSMRAKDSNITQALVDRFAPYGRNKGKGTKKEPGFFYGFKSDIWQAFALGVTWWDLNKGMP